MHHSGASLWSAWQLAPEILIPTALLIYWVLRKSTLERRQKILLLSGALSIMAVVNSPVGARAGDYFTLHMIQHVTLMMITGPLLVLGTPARFNPTATFFRVATHPILSWFTYAALMIGVHLPPIHNFIMYHSWAHDYVEVPLYIAIPYFFYFNLLHRNQITSRISPAMAVISLFLMMVPETLTGFFIYASPHSLYDGMYTLTDQQRGGSFMWAGSMMIDALWMGMAVHHWIKSEERKAIEIDKEIAAEQQ